MSFINKSVDVSQTVLLKKNLVAPVLEECNKHAQKQASCISVSTRTWKIPNNNVKYYLFITPKEALEKCNDKYDLLYFFPDTHSNTASDTGNDFYMEINSTFKNTCLFEGYLYTHNGHYTYLMTDILFYKNKTVAVDYPLRFAMLNELVIHKQLKHLNEHMTIGLHCVFEEGQEGLQDIFIHNFVFARDICCIEHISNSTKQCTVYQPVNHTGVQNKVIEKGKYPDVYNVFDCVTNDPEGILYVQTLADSRQLKSICNGTQRVVLPCVYNSRFMKWQYTNKGLGLLEPSARTQNGFKKTE